MPSPGKGAMNIDCLRCEKAPSLFDIPHRMAASVLWSPTFFAERRDIVGQLARDWQLAAIFTAQSGRPFSVWNGAAFSAGGDYNADGGGGAVGGGFYDRPDAPVSGLPSNFSTQDFLNGLFDASLFPKPAAGTNGTLGRNTFRGPRYMTLDLARVPLAVEDAQPLDARRRLNGETSPNYVRALQQMPPQSGPALAEAVQAFLYRGTLPTGMKAAMGVRIAQVNDSPYVAAHIARVLRGPRIAARKRLPRSITRRSMAPHRAMVSTNRSGSPCAMPNSSRATSTASRPKISRGRVRSSTTAKSWN